MLFRSDWKGAFWLLVMVFVLSSFLDNIAAAMIGGAMAHTPFRAKVHIGYLAAIVAASRGDVMALAQRVGHTKRLQALCSVVTTTGRRRAGMVRTTRRPTAAINGL